MIPTRTATPPSRERAVRWTGLRERRFAPRLAPHLVLLLVLLLVLQALGCADEGLAPLRAVTYPPDFHYLTRAEIQGTMAEFARSVDALDRILAQAGGPGAADRDAVVGILEQLRLQARHLEQGEDSNHPGLHQDASRFTRDLDRALVGVRREPPDFSGTARIAGSCTACHAPRHPGAA